ncbi:hypothetical protein [Gloeothece verrucosa]|uniref:Uncharacterized protein n=1 Tax=Gloeothece verrucosa (strain PCC 7822) TaxID=497965 RepID=E0UCB3_GLOV7|nr:hypothetical protein [Gloeothece verrucosa]ADN12870.1 hypothetical protein Cyan7822_0850 [Gloeothece verrucosa PCC 7822]
MSSYTRGKLRDVLTFVLLYDTPVNIYYNWSAKDIATLAGVSKSDLTSHLGHLTTVANTSIVIVGASSPKPPTVKKNINRNPTAKQQGSVSTFCARASLNTALVNGWKLAGHGRVTSIKNNARTVTALAGISNGAVYASPMNAGDYADYKTELALIDPATINTANERNLIVRGASRPRAAHATKTLADGSTISGYYSPDAPILANGWTPDSPEIT